MNYLYYGDCLDILSKYVPEKSVDLIYIDPPYNSKKNYNIIYDRNIAQAEAFSDTWSLASYQEHKELVYERQPVRYKSLHNIFALYEKLLINKNPNLLGYLITIAIRLVELYIVLKDTGSFYIHIDPNTSHYLKIILDEIFGHKNFRNEIIWHYQTGGNSKKLYAKKHDVILFYSKGKNYTFEPDRIKIKRTGEVLKRLKSGNKNATRATNEYKLPMDVWQIQALNAMASERLGYPTQKPLELMETIIKASSNKGDTVLDAFCGCGTTISACNKLNRKWIGIDITYLAIDVIKSRLMNSFYAMFDKNKAEKQFDKDVSIIGIPKDMAGVNSLLKQGSNRKEFEKWAILSIGGIPNDKIGSDNGIDGYFLYSKNAEMKKGVIQVKSGKTSVRDIRDFAHVIDREYSGIGIFITLKEPTKNMLNEINRMSLFKVGNKSFKKIILVTIRDILKNIKIDLPIIDKKYKQAKKVSNTKNLF